MAARLAFVDLIDQASFTRDTNGWKYARLFEVDGLEAFNADERLYQAALPSNYGGELPDFGQLHPHIPLLRVENVQCNLVPGCANKARITFTYGYATGKNNPPSESGGLESGNTTSEMGATITGIKQYVDKDGADMVFNAFEINGNIQEAQYANFENLTASNPYAMFYRREPAPFNVAKVLKYVNTVNSTAWFFGKSRTWKCTAIRGTEKGGAFDVRYEFQYNRSTWDVEAQYVNPTTNAPYKGATFQNGGKKIWRVYPEENFTELNLL